MAIWALVAAAAYQLQDFFGITMGTFIVSFIGNGFVQSSDATVAQLFKKEDPTVRRRILVVIFFSSIAAVLAMFGLLTIPDIIREGVEFVGRLQSDNIWVMLVQKMREGLGDQIMESVERFIVLAASSDLTLMTASLPGDWTIERSEQLGMAVSKLLKGYTTTAATVTAGLLSSVTKLALQVRIGAWGKAVSCRMTSFMTACNARNHLPSMNKTTPWFTGVPLFYTQNHDPIPAFVSHKKPPPNFGFVLPGRCA